jgi:energy-converting hydrogenase Eha subunit E
MTYKLLNFTGAKIVIIGQLAFSTGPAENQID